MAEFCSNGALPAEIFGDFKGLPHPLAEELTLRTAFRALIGAATAVKRPEVRGLIEFAQDPYLKADLFDCCKATADYVDQHNVSAVAFVDRSARPMWIGLNEYWEKTHGDKPGPDYYFVNPDGFRDQRDIEKRLETEHRRLARHKQDTVLLVDTCMHSGSAMKPVIEGLQKGGFQDVRIAIASNRRNTSGITPDLVMLEYSPAGLCFPFGYNPSEVKKGSRLHSEISSRDMLTNFVTTKLRQVIIGTINDHLEGGDASRESAMLEAQTKRKRVKHARRLGALAGGAIGLGIANWANLRSHGGLVHDIIYDVLDTGGGIMWGRFISILVLESKMRRERQRAT